MFKISQKLLLILLLSSFLIFHGDFIAAKEADSLKLSLTPPLFKVKMDPGGIWSSTIKIINNNPYSITVYSQITDFKSGAEGGVEFIKEESANQAEKYFLSQWVEISKDPIDIDALGSKEIPFVIRLPEDASPGGHYAAILIGNKPNDKIEGTGIKISSMLASLLLVRVDGDINEDGEIREFSTDKTLAKNLEANFTVRFINTGNVHLQPRGEIKITNMFGEPRGTVPINNNSEYGNVLPGSEKKWQFSWQGESGIWDAGRMRADLSLSYGEESKQSDFKTIYFWTVNLKPTLAILGSILFLIFLIFYFIRRSIKKAVYSAKEDVLAQGSTRLLNSISTESAKAVLSKTAAVSKGGAPIINLRDSLNKNIENAWLPKNLFSGFLKWRYIKELFILLILVLMFFGAYILYKESNAKDGEVVGRILKIFKLEENKGDVIEKTSEAGEKENIQAKDLGNVSEAPILPPPNSQAVKEAPVVETEEKVPAEPPKLEEKTVVDIKILNGSGQIGAASMASDILKKEEGLNIISLGNADNFNYSTTIIKYKKESKSRAEIIDNLLGGENKLEEEYLLDGDVEIILGKNFK